MTQKHSLILLCFLIFFSPLFAQEADEAYHRARIHLEGQSIQELSILGIETDHGQYAPKRHFISDFSESELRLVAEAGFTYDILIRDVIDYYQSPERRAAESDNARGGSPCPETGNNVGIGAYATPEHFRLGQMAGFYTYDELLDILDSMRLLYPHLISSRQAVSSDITTHDGNPIYWMRISDNPDTEEEAEPEVLYTALHHAREPSSLTQMVFYMWYLLENYETDEEVRFIVDHTALYFIPCVNPDGYIHNCTYNPNGGGLWRKNRRNNGDGYFGVDLNRNYGFEWGHNNIGSSSNTYSNAYRGPEAFSEPETQTIQAFCEAHEFAVALNHHAAGNLLVYPWQYNDGITPDATTFNTLAAIMTLQNDFTTGTGTATLGYTLNGTADDWMYGDTLEKPSIFAFTPELGDDGFWPAQEDIIPNCKSVLWLNMAAAEAVHVSGIVAPDPDQVEIQTPDPNLAFQIQRFGRTPGPLTVRLHSLQEDIIQVAGLPQTYNLEENAFQSGSFPLSVVGNVEPGTLLRFILEIDNGSFSRADTVTRPFGDFMNTAVFTEDFPDLNSWSNEENWGLTEEDFYSAPSSLTDSPYENYPDDQLSSITLNDPIIVNDAEAYQLRFWAKWGIEAHYDWAQLQVQVNGSPWLPACGLFTVLGSENQDPDQPVWEGEQPNWVQERIDLNFLSEGDELRIRFLLVSDEFVNSSGFFIDDIVFLERNPNTVNTSTLLGNDHFTVKVTPNPTRQQSQLQIRFPNAYHGLVQWQLLAVSGQVVKNGTTRSHAGYAATTINTTQLPAGTYFLRVQTNEHQPITKRIIKTE